jgi:hypothetical protein
MMGGAGDGMKGGVSSGSAIGLLLRISQGACSLAALHTLGSPTGRRMSTYQHRTVPALGRARESTKFRGWT